MVDMALGCSMPRPDNVRCSRMASYSPYSAVPARALRRDVTGRIVFGSGATIAAMSLASQKGIGMYQRRRPVHDNVSSNSSRRGTMCGPPNS